MGAAGGDAVVLRSVERAVYTLDPGEVLEIARGEYRANLILDDLCEAVRLLPSANPVVDD